MKSRNSFLSLSTGVGILSPLNLFVHKKSILFWHFVLPLYKLQPCGFDAVLSETIPSVLSWQSTKTWNVIFYASWFLFLCTTCNKSTWLIFMFSIIKTLLLLYKVKIPLVRTIWPDRPLHRCTTSVLSNLESWEWPNC